MTYNNYQNIKLGSLWLKTSKNGNTKYMNGNITVNGQKIYISVLKNNKKDKETTPDYYIFTSANNNQGNNHAGSGQSPNNNNNNNYNSQNDYDVPF